MNEPRVGKGALQSMRSRGRLRDMNKRKPATGSRRPRQARPHSSTKLQLQRLRLFEALGIIEVSRHALATKLVGLDEDSVIEALRAAYRIVDDVAGELELSNSPRGLPPTQSKKGSR
jgi:hypothetical protein